MSKIAVDLDATLYDFETPAREAFLKLAEKYDDKRLFAGAYHPWTEWRSPNDVCGHEIWMEAIAMCHDAEVIRSQVPFSGSVETCQALVSEGHELIYISNRATESYDATAEWLDAYGFLYAGDEEVVCMMEDKRPYLADCQYLIDDRPRTVIEFLYDDDYPKGERRAFVLAYPYNQNLTDIPRVYLSPTWAGLNYYLVSKGVLSKPAATPTLKV